MVSGKVYGWPLRAAHNFLLSIRIRANWFLFVVFCFYFFYLARSRDHAHRFNCIGIQWCGPVCRRRSLLPWTWPLSVHTVTGRVQARLMQSAAVHEIPLRLRCKIPPMLARIEHRWVRLTLSSACSVCPRVSIVTIVAHALCAHKIHLAFTYEKLHFGRTQLTSTFKHLD